MKQKLRPKYKSETPFPRDNNEVYQYTYFFVVITYYIFELIINEAKLKFHIT